MPDPAFRADIFDLTATPDGGQRLASFAVRVYRSGGTQPFVTLHNYRIIESKNGGVFVAPPRYAAGPSDYRPIVVFPTLIEATIATAATAAWERLTAAPPASDLDDIVLDALPF